ncbi:MAG: DUF3857 domain-containing protein [Planctomycetota bacterium]
MDTPSNGVNIVTPRALAKTPAYATHREAVISHVGIEMNALLELEVEIADKKGDRAGLCGIEVFGDRVPILEKTLRVQVPDVQELRSEIAGTAPGKGMAGTKGFWTLRNIPARPEEPHAPPRVETCPRVAYTYRTSRTDWGKAFAARFREAANSALPADLQKRLEAIRNTRPSPAERIVALDALIRSRVAPVRHRFERIGLRPAGTTWAEGYGHAADRGALLCACLRTLEMEAHPVFYASTRTPTVLALLPPWGYPALWLEIRAGERTWSLDALGRAAETGLLGPAGLGCFDPQAEKTPCRKGREPALSDRQACVQGSVRIYPDGTVEARLLIELKGSLNPLIRKWEGKGNPRGFAEEKIKGLFKEAKTRKFIEIHAGQDRTVMAFEVKAKAGIPKEGDVFRFTLPETIFLPALALPATDRALPYRFLGAMAEKVELQVTIPKTWKVAASPAPVSGEIEGAIRLGTLAWKKEEGFLLFRSVEITGQDIGRVNPPSTDATMQNFRALLARWKAENGRTLLFTAAPDPRKK